MRSSRLATTATSRPSARTTSPPERRYPHRAGRWCGWTGRCSGCRPASGWTWAPRRRAWARTAPCVPPCPPPGGAAACWSASAATSPWPGSRRRTAGRSPWPRSRTVSRPASRRPSCSGCPRARSRPRRSPSGAGAAAARRCTTSWTRGPGGPRTDRGAPRPWSRRPARTPTRPARRRSWRAPRAEEWLAATGLPARLTGHDGRVRALNGWPGPEAAAGAPVPVPAGSRVYAGGPR